MKLPIWKLRLIAGETDIAVVAGTVAEDGRPMFREFVVLREEKSTNECGCVCCVASICPAACD